MPKRKEAGEPSQSREPDQEELDEPRANFTVQDWDNFYSIRGVDVSFEKNAEWPQLKSLLTEYLLFRPKSPKNPEQPQKLATLPAKLRILVPGCGNSRLSEHLYDAGFLKITNVDTSEVVIRNMLNRNGLDRPKMKWRLENMTKLPMYADESFDAIVDKGAYDTLMAAEHDASNGYNYLHEVKRLLRDGGKFICVTILEFHALDLFFLNFRFGWKMSLHTIALEPPSEQEHQIFMVVLEKDRFGNTTEISAFLDDDFAKYHGDQARELIEALDNEKVIRAKYATFTINEISYSLAELKQGLRGHLSTYEPGRRILLHFGAPKLYYNCILLDAKQDSGSFFYPYCVYIVPKLSHNDLFYRTEEGQWLIVESTRAARLLMAFPVSSGSHSLEDIRGDLAKYARQLKPVGYPSDVNTFDILFKFQIPGDGNLKQEIVHQGVSKFYGTFYVEDYNYQALNCNGLKNDRKFRSLMYKIAENLVKDDALLSKKGSAFDSHLSTASSNEMEVDHNYLTCAYHKAIFPGLMLIYKYRKISYSMEDLSKGLIIGLGVGLLPMFMKAQFPSLKIEVFELDPQFLDVARDYFGLKEDERLKVHTGDGIAFVEELEDSEAEDKLDFLIVDVPSSSLRTRMDVPDEIYVEEPFLLAAKQSLSEHGIFVIHLAPNLTAVRDAVYARLKKVFCNMFRLKLAENMNEVIFAMKSDDPINKVRLSQARNELAKSPQRWDQWNQHVLDLTIAVQMLKL